MFCQTCGAALDDGAKFCTSCGTRVPADEPIGPDPDLLSDGIGQTPDDIRDEHGREPSEDGRVSNHDDHVGDSKTASATSPKDGDTPQSYDDNDVHGNRSRRPRSRIVAVIVAVVVVVVLCVVGALVVPGLLDRGDSDGGNRDVVYYGSDQATNVLPSTSIILYGDDGEPLDEYDVTLMSQDGDVLTTHVTDGQFTPEQAGAQPGQTYTAIARDQDNTIHDIPDLTVADNTDADGSTDDGSTDSRDDTAQNADGDQNVHEHLEVRPQPDADDTDNDTNAQSDSADNDRRTAYALFYDKIQELQNQYGEGRTVDGSSTGEQWIEGLGFVQLLDINDDGIEELVVAHCPQGQKIDSDVPGYMNAFFDEFSVEVFQFNAGTSTLDQVYESPAYFTNGGLFYVNILSRNGGGYIITGIDYTPISDDADAVSVTYNEHVLTNTEDGILKSVTFSTETTHMYTQDAEERYYIDGKAVDEQQAKQQRDALGLTDAYSYEIHSTLYNPGVTDDEYTCQKTLDDAKATIEQITHGMMNGFDDTEAGDSDSVDTNEDTDSEAWKQAYIDRINRESNKSSHTTGGTYTLIDIDGNEIPEVYTRWSSEAEGGTVYSYAQDKVIEQVIQRSGFTYIEGRNLFMNFGGIMGNYFNLVYSIENGQFVEVARGQYLEENDNGNWSFRYYWNHKEVGSESEYTNLLDSVYDATQAVDPLEDATFNASTSTYTGDGIYDLYGVISAIRSY